MSHATKNWDKTCRLELLCSALLVWGLLLVTSLSQASVASSTQTLGQSTEQGSGSLMVSSVAGDSRELPRLNTDFSLRVSGMVVQATVTQVFINDSDQWLEGKYVFPLPSNSAVNGLTIRIGDRLIEGEIKEKQAARKIFLKARAQGKKASLVEQQRPNMFTNQVTNIAPGEQIKVELRYLQTLRYDHGEFSLRIPMTITPRYVPGHTREEPMVELGVQKATVQGGGWAFNTDQVPDASFVTPPQRSVAELEMVNRGVGPVNDDVLDSTLTNVATVHITLTPGFELASLTSSYHQISSEKQSDKYTISTKKPWVLMNRDFVLRWRPVANQAPVAAFFSESILFSGNVTDEGDVDEDNDVEEGSFEAGKVEHHGLLLVMPPTQIMTQHLQSRELVLVIDTSGSMAGTSMEQAKQALLVALERLSDKDYFNVIEFNSHTYPLFDRSVIANQENINKAKRKVLSLQANGGTEMRGALQMALMPPELPGAEEEKVSTRVRQVVFITDGSVSNEETLFTYIVNNVGKSRLFTVAIGSAPNGYFMKKAAQFGRGLYTSIGSVHEVRSTMSALFEKISKPLLVDISVAFHNAGLTEYYPTKIPDLYADQPLMMYVKLAEKTDTVTIQGEYEGRYWQQDVVPNWNASHEGVGTLWARQKIEYLMDEAVRQGNSDQFRQEITLLAIHYKIMSRYTSFVAVDKTPSRLQSNLVKRDIPNSMPAGSTQPVPSVAYPNTALGINGMVVSGSLLLFLGLLILCWKQDRLVLRTHYPICQGGGV